MSGWVWEFFGCSGQLPPSGVNELSRRARDCSRWRPKSRHSLCSLATSTGRTGFAAISSRKTHSLGIGRLGADKCRNRFCHLGTALDRPQLERASLHQGTARVNPEWSLCHRSPPYLRRLTAGSFGDCNRSWSRACPARFSNSGPGLVIQAAHGGILHGSAIRARVSGI
jgi:hypothetical protein